MVLNIISKCILLLRCIKIRKRIAIFLLILLITSSVSIFQWSKIFAQSMIRKYINEYVDLTQKQISTNVELMISDINMLAVRLLINQNIYQLFDIQGQTYEEKRTNLRKILDKLIVHKEIVGDIQIVTSSFDTYSYTSYKKEIEEQDLEYIHQIEKSQVPVWGPVKKDIDGSAYILLGRKYQNFYTGQKLGYLIIYIREEALYNIYRKMMPDYGYSFILANGQYIISHPDKLKVGSVVLDETVFNADENYDHKMVNFQGQPVILAIGSFSDYLENIGIDWKMVSVISEKKLFSAVDTLNKYILVMEIIIVGFSLFLTLYLSVSVTRPVARLREKLNKFNGGNDIEYDGYSRDEVGDLEQSYINMTKRIKELIQKNNEEKEKQREKELTALQAQINPHFIYNTLDAIGWIAKLKNQEDIEKMVISLATFFRISLHKGDKYITVGEEIQLIKSFVSVEQMRFPNKFDITYDIPDEVMKYRIIKIILQPLVENAIKHGISNKRGKGHIAVTGLREKDVLRFKVEDDGIGFDITQINDTNSHNSMPKSGYGMMNVDERIKLEYGQEYGLKVESRIGIGTKVEVSLKI